MNHDPDRNDAGKLPLPTTMSPPPELENRLVEQLAARGLISTGAGPRSARGRWRSVRSAFAIAACVSCLLIGWFWGSGSHRNFLPASVLDGTQTDLYALLLYETDGYDKAQGEQALSRYREYSAWVAEARRRGQFVGGEDLTVDQGWQISASSDGSQIEPATAVAGGAPLTGIFFLRAQNANEALALARDLPHVKHGGQVLVQKVVPTDAPPSLDEDQGSESD